MSFFLLIVVTYHVCLGFKSSYVEAGSDRIPWGYEITH